MLPFSPYKANLSKNTPLVHNFHYGQEKGAKTSQALSLPKKTSTSSSSSNAPLRTKGTKDVYPLILPPSTQGLVFVNDAQQLKFETLSARKASEQKF